jgi:hypothetical protein
MRKEEDNFDKDMRRRAGGCAPASTHGRRIQWLQHRVDSGGGNALGSRGSCHVEGGGPMGRTPRPSGFWFLILRPERGPLGSFCWDGSATHWFDQLCAHLWWIWPTRVGQDNNLSHHLNLHCIPCRSSGRWLLACPGNRGRRSGSFAAVRGSARRHRGCPG